MRSYRSFGLPGIDMLCNRYEFTTAKQCQSAVHQYGRVGMLSELDGVTGWDFDFRGHKLHGDWQAALGVTIRVPHLAWVSMKGEAKRDYPASISYQSSWWKEYSYIEDHFARVNTALTRGKPMVRVAVLHPIESYWLHWGPSNQTATERDKLEKNFENVTEWLLKGSIDFDYICESLFPSLNVGSGEHTFRVTYSAPHAGYAFDGFSGRFICTDCGAHCEHTSFTENKCNLCGFVCVHNWEDNGATAVCTVCGKICTSQEIPKLDYSCTSCENSSSYHNGVCAECGTECNHVFNAGGHCVICGEFGNAITFADGRNGGGNISDTESNGDALTDGDSVYCSQSGSYKQTWDYRDESGSLLGRSYVFSGMFNFSEWKYVSENGAGTTRLLIWADGDVNASSTKFALYMFGNNGKLEIGPDEKDASTRYELEINRDYDIRVAVRSEEISDGKFPHTADIYIDGKLMWTRRFNLTAQNGISIRVGDHTARQTQVKYSVSNDFGIRCIDNAISFIGVQEKENANYNYDLTYDLRFIFGIEDLYLGDVGVKVEAKMMGGTLDEDVSGKITRSSSKTVFKSIMFGGKVCTPGAYGAGYGGNYIALAITDIPLDTGIFLTSSVLPVVRSLRR